MLIQKESWIRYSDTENIKHLVTVKNTNLINVSFIIKYVQLNWNVVQVIMKVKPGRSQNEISSCRSIVYCLHYCNRLENLLKRLKVIIEDRSLVPVFVFGFTKLHVGSDITNVIMQAPEEKKFVQPYFWMYPKLQWRSSSWNKKSITNTIFSVIRILYMKQSTKKKRHILS